MCASLSVNPTLSSRSANSRTRRLQLRYLGFISVLGINAPASGPQSRCEIALTGFNPEPKRPIASRWLPSSL